MSFKKLKLCSEILHACKDKGYVEATDIQKEAIEYLVRKRDLLLIAKTGTGKTAAFTLPMLQDIYENKHKYTQLTKLVIAPTKELAIQLEKNIKEYGKYLEIKTAVIYGGANINAQVKLLQSKVNVVICTTGRLVDLIKNEQINLTKVDTLVLDEADTMLDLGFIQDIEFIVQYLPNLTQTVLSSASLGPNVKELSNILLTKPKVIEVKSHDRVNENLEQIVYPVYHKDKFGMLSFLIGSKNMKKVIVFCKTKALADSLVKHLKLDGLKSAAVHGGKTPGFRKKVIEQFREESIRVLVATDVAARGIDIPDLDNVINFDMPFLITDYLHRVGRTARAGKSGTATSLVDEYDMGNLREIEKYLEQKIERSELEGFKVDKRILSLSKKKIIHAKEDSITKKTTAGAFGKKKRQKEQSRQPKIRGKRILGQKRQK